MFRGRRPSFEKRIEIMIMRKEKDYLSSYVTFTYEKLQTRTDRFLGDCVNKEDILRLYDDEILKLRDNPK